MFGEFVIGNGEPAVLQKVPQMLGAGPFIARRVDRIEADESSRQFDGVEGIVHGFIYPRSVAGRPIQPVIDHHLRYPAPALSGPDSRTVSHGAMRVRPDRPDPRILLPAVYIMTIVKLVETRRNEDGQRWTR